MMYLVEKFSYLHYYIQCKRGDTYMEIGQNVFLAERRLLYLQNIR